MKKVNILIIALLITGICALVLVEGYVKPEMRRREQQYLFRAERSADPRFQPAAGVQEPLHG